MNKTMMTIYVFALAILISCKSETDTQNDDSMLNANEITQEVINPIPESISLQIKRLNENGFGIEMSNIELTKQANTENYSFSVPNEVCMGDDYFYFSGKDAGTWEYETAPCGSGGGSIKGVIIFLSGRIVNVETFTSCAGAADCYEYITLGVNGKESFSKKYSMND
jgi:hypothetical protein